MKPNEYIFDEVEVRRVSPKAILVRGGEFKEDTWLPKSQLKVGTTVEEVGDIGTVVIPEWLAEAKNLFDSPGKEETGKHAAEIEDDDPPF